MTTILKDYSAIGGKTIILHHPGVIEALRKYSVDTKNPVSGASLTMDEAVEEILYSFLVAHLYDDVT